MNGLIILLLSSTVPAVKLQMELKNELSKDRVVIVFRLLQKHLKESEVETEAYLRNMFPEFRKEKEWTNQTQVAEFFDSMSEDSFKSLQGLLEHQKTMQKVQGYRSFKRYIAVHLSDKHEKYQYLLDQLNLMAAGKKAFEDMTNEQGSEHEDIEDEYAGEQGKDVVTWAFELYQKGPTH